MEELRAQFPGEDLDELIERYTDHRSEEEKARSWTLWWMSWCAGKTGTRLTCV